MSVKKGTSTIAGRTQVDATPVSGSNNAVSSGGVYTALQEKADASIANTVASLSTALAAKANDNEVVHTTGNETVGGTKWFGNLAVRNSTAIRGTAPASSLYWGVSAWDKNTPDSGASWQEHRMGVLEWALLTDNTMQVTLNAMQNVAGASTSNAALTVVCKSDGTKYVTAPEASVNGSVLVTSALNRNQSGYLKLGNHLLIQWGTWYISAADTTVTLPTAFADANYIIGASTETKQMGNVACYTKTTTTFKAWTSDDSSFNAAQLNYIAIGRW